VTGVDETEETGKTTWAFMWFLLHTIVWIAGVRLLPGEAFIPYAEIGRIGTPWVSQFVLPLGIVLVLQLAALRKLGWWGNVFRETEKIPGIRIWIPPTIMLALTAYAATQIGGGIGGSYYMGLALTCLLVGATEEITFRGALLVALRRGGGSETTAFLVSSALFGLFHLPNLLIGGETVAVLRQVVVTAIFGGAFYALRRASGSLLPCIALHAVYDAMILASVA